MQFILYSSALVANLFILLYIHAHPSVRFVICILLKYKFKYYCLYIETISGINIAFSKSTREILLVFFIKNNTKRFFK